MAVAGHAVGEGAALLDDEERLEPGRARLPLLGVAHPGQHLDEVGGQRVAGPALAAGQHPVVAVAHRAGLHARRGRTRRSARTARWSRSSRPGADRRSSSALRSVVDDLRAEALPAGQDAADATARRGRAPRDTRQYSKTPRPRPPCSAGTVMPNQPCAAMSSMSAGRHLALLRVELVGERQHDVARERARLLLQRAALGRRATATAARGADGRARGSSPGSGVVSIAGAHRAPSEPAVQWAGPRDRGRHEHPHRARHRVVVIGSGFGGLFATKALRRADVDVTLIDRTTHHLFQPLLYQVATGILSEGEIAPPTRDILRRQKNAPRAARRRRDDRPRRRRPSRHASRQDDRHAVRLPHRRRGRRAVVLRQRRASPSSRPA